MIPSNKIYLAYWRQLKEFIDERGLDWTFPSFEAENEMVIKIGSPKRKICLALLGKDSRNPKPLVSASFWIPDSQDDFLKLKARKEALEAEMGKSLVWDSLPGRKSCWVRITTVMDLSNEKNWPASFEWFAQNAEKIRDVCHKHLN